MSRAPRCAPAPAPLVRTPASPRAIVHRRGRACASLHFHAPPTGRPEPRRAAHSPASRRASRVAGVQAPRGAPGASALASSARVRRPEIVPVRRPAGVGRPAAAGFGWAGGCVL